MEAAVKMVFVIFVIVFNKMDTVVVIVIVTIVVGGWYP